jgi:hypothetical protein
MTYSQICQKGHYLDNKLRFTGIIINFQDGDILLNNFIINLTTTGK